ncbi:hypothetical protein BDR26DRAFT_820864 [Obelidium mucronatum]|nr:hypothetical protein BDR26DRAFT_820864 [Obelidium mucronatum]
MLAMTSSNSTPLSLVSHRLEISDTGHRGTIRYEGEIDGKSWLGVEWDDPSRGKHSGQDPKNAAVYLFKVSVPNSASFIRADSSKVLLARTFLSAVRERYVDDNSEELKVNQNVKSSGLKTRRPNEDVEVEMVGWEKMRQKLSSLKGITILGLAGMQIGWVDQTLKRIQQQHVNTDSSDTIDADQSPNAIQQTFPLVQDLDLSRNLFQTWEDVARITIELPHLESLRLNSNRLVFDHSVTLDPEGSLLTAGFGNLKILALNSTNICWDDVERLAPHIPHIEALFLGFNNMESLGDAKYPPSTDVKLNEDLQQPQQPPLFPNLTAFHLDQNNLSSWPQICRLVSTHMPRLTTLNLSNNKITDITTPLLLQIETIFPHLTTLNLTCNKINSYTSIHALNSFPVLVDIRVRDNPCLLLHPPTQIPAAATAAGRDSTTTASHISRSDEITARLAKATRINGKMISQRDRSDAELYYLGKVAQWVHGLRTSTSAAGTINTASVSAPGGTDEAAAAAMTQRESAIQQLVQEFHPRYKELCGIHGEPEVAPASVTSNALKDRLVVLVFCLIEGQEVAASAAAGDVKKRVEKKVPLTMTLRALRALVGRVLGVKGGGFRMRGVSGVVEAKERGPGGGAGGVTGTVELDEEMREVGYFDFVNGDEIHVFV